MYPPLQCHGSCFAASKPRASPFHLFLFLPECRTTLETVVLPFPECPISESFRTASLSSIYLRFLHVFCALMAHFFLTAQYHFIIQMYYSLWVHMKDILANFWQLWINKAAKNIWVQVLVWTWSLIHLDKYLGVQLTLSVRLWLTLRDCPTSSSVPCCIPITNEFQFLLRHILDSIWCCILDFSSCRY